jgi:signal transduction histidine kinase
VAGLRGATGLLAANPDRPDRSRLLALMTAELGRLGIVLNHDRREPLSAFNLAEALASVIAAHRLRGARIDAQLHGVRALGRPGATATVLDNLLTNAEVHAHGADVVIRAHGSRSGRVVVTVDDSGPGMPSEEHALVARAGVRGTRARAADRPGSGLGLHSAQIAMTGQGGTLRVDRRPGGGTRVLLTLLAPPDRAAAPVIASRAS